MASTLKVKAMSSALKAKACTLSLKVKAMSPNAKTFKHIARAEIKMYVWQLVCFCLDTNLGPRENNSCSA